MNSTGQRGDAAAKSMRRRRLSVLFARCGSPRLPHLAGVTGTGRCSRSFSLCLAGTVRVTADTPSTNLVRKMTSALLNMPSLRDTTTNCSTEARLGQLSKNYPRERSSRTYAIRRKSIQGSRSAVDIFLAVDIC